MKRHQIQLPDDVFAHAKMVCEAREISMAELARRGIEYMLSIYAPEPKKGAEWHPPKPRRLGWKGLNDEELKQQARLTNTQEALAKG